MAQLLSSVDQELSAGVSPATITQLLSLGAAATVVVRQLLSCALSAFVPAKPLSAPTATTVEKAAASTERSILLCIVGFVLI
ncbi:hypothetical protein [Streptomyces sp. WM6391]|uniref:hypothetical protein n=1 Tax=Streptomyces sp. WM6391 TaxID=1415559 RepID=UPI000619960A|nr:hypothetical protein [Streptomyces sp. WM6391]KKD07541.1 hypothetical protein TN53_12585 [Streptomyces sp. WM6386]KKD15153.1 hypothetical protein TR66_11650 [Streptomyces sp. WM6391]